jgi:hypothetical protein
MLNALCSLTAQHIHRHTAHTPSVCNPAVCVLEVCSALVAAEVAEPAAAQRGNAAEHGTKRIAVSRRRIKSSTMDAVYHLSGTDTHVHISEM